jgi:uncharacterized protein YbjT (DUF2867 family)
MACLDPNGMDDSRPQNDRSDRASRGPLIALTGATGYVGGRLLRRLVEGGRRVRCLARRPEHLAGRVDAGTEVVHADVLDAATLPAALEGVDTAYYLVHSMGSSGDFAAQDRAGARHFGDAARDAGVRRIIYLGGLADPGESLSAHLRSRHETGDELRVAGVPVVELRASIVLGSGSLSFEMVRALVERLPVMVTPRWVDVEAQPIAVDDLLDYLFAAIDVPLSDGHHTFEVGGADRVSYGEIMREYARQRGLRRRMLPVPVLSPRLSSLWLGLVTPLYARVGSKLIDSVRHPSVVRDTSALAVFDVRPVGHREAIARALRNEDREVAETRWCDALSAGGPQRRWGGVRFGSRIVDSRSMRVDVPPARAFVPIRRIGGTTGWYAHDALWGLRGFLDLLVGGVGLRRGRHDDDHLAPGDTVDFWRVEAYEPDHLLRLVAEMKLPGRAWLEFRVDEDPDGGGSIVHQTAIFDPVGLLGLAYWYALFPLHGLVFGGMLRGIAGAATR